MLIALVASALLFDFLNGFHDSANLVATVIASRALAPRPALVLTALAEFAGPFLFGVAVARTVGAGLLDPGAVSLPAVLAAVWAAIAWNLLTWYLGLPSSSSHALVGGLLGAAIVSQGWAAVQVSGLLKILAALLISPPLGFLIGFLLMRLIRFLGRAATPRINTFFKRGQIFTSAGLALSHGTNDAQKTMGLITLALLAAGRIESFAVPPWVVAASAAAIAVGILSGGWRLIRTLGGRMYRIRPVDGFTAQAAAAAVILTAGAFGGPVSSTQVAGSAILGAGAADRLGKVRWQVAGNMLWAWVLTMPLSGLVGALLYFPVARFAG